MTNLVVFNIYWYLIVSVIITFWILADTLSNKTQGLVGKVWDWFVFLLGLAAWYMSINTFQLYMLGKLSQERIEDMDSWVNVYLTLGYLILRLIAYKLERKKCA